MTAGDWHRGTWSAAATRRLAQGNSSHCTAEPATPHQSVGFHRPGRDPGQVRSVHLSGVARGRAVPSRLPRPSGAPTRRRVRTQRTEHRRSRPMPLPTPSSAPRGGHPLTRRPAQALIGTGGAISPLAPPSLPQRSANLPPAHRALICVALPGLAISPEQGQLTGQGLEGFYRAGRRMLSRCRLRVAGREPLAVQARMIAAGQARFVATLSLSVDAGPTRRSSSNGRDTRTARSGSRCAARPTAICACLLKWRSARTWRNWERSPPAGPVLTCPPAFTTRACGGPAPPGTPLSRPTRRPRTRWLPQDCCAGSSNCRPATAEVWS